jgi:hypothetical protein
MSGPGGISGPGTPFGETVANKQKMYSSCSGGVETTMYRTTYSGGMSPPNETQTTEQTAKNCGPETKQKTEPPKPEPTNAAIGGINPAVLGVGAAAAAAAAAAAGGGGDGITGTTGTTGTR